MTTAPFPYRVIERVSTVTPLGVRFVDTFSGAPVNTGLEVWAWPEGTPTLRVPMRRAGSGAYAAHGLPGLRVFEAGAGDDAFWETWRAPANKRVFVVEARDSLSRFLPVRARVEVPARGLAEPLSPALLPADRGPGVPLFSAPTRMAPATAATIRGHLFDRSARHPASWAIVDAKLDGRVIAHGMADGDGQLLLLFPYPEPQSSWISPPPASPASPPRRPLADQSWPIDIEVRYDRTLPRHAAPDVGDALAQHPAGLLADAASPSLPLTQITLQYGSAAVLRTADTTSEERGHVLVITSGSPL